MTYYDGCAEAGAQERPAVVTVLCAVGLVCSVCSAPMIFSEGARVVGDWYQVSLGWLLVASLIGVAGMWQMRRFGVYLYVAAAVVGQLLLVYNDGWLFTDIIYPAVYCGVALTQVRRMS